MTRYSPPPPLPLSGHQVGRAAPLPSRKTPAEQPPAPQPKAEPVRVVIPDCEDDNPDTDTVLADDAAVDDIAAAAGRVRRAAQLAAGRAEHDLGEATAIIEAAQAEAARILAEAESAARPLATSASAAQRESAALGVRAQRLTAAAQGAVKAAASAARVQALEDERDDLAGQQAEMTRRIQALGAERSQAQSGLTAATEAADLDAMTSARNRISSVDDLVSVLAGQRAKLQERLAAIGDGGMRSAERVQKELYEARRLAGHDRSSLRGILNDAFPERPEALADAERRRRLEQETYEIAQYDARRAEQARQAPRRQVALGG